MLLLCEINATQCAFTSAQAERGEKCCSTAGEFRPPGKDIQVRKSEPQINVSNFNV